MTTTLPPATDPARPETAPAGSRTAGHRSRFGGLGLALRSRSAARGASVLVGCLVFVLAALLVAGPSLFDRLTTAELSHTLNAVPPQSRYLTARTTDAMIKAPSARGDHGASRGLSPDQDTIFGTFIDQLDAVSPKFPEPLASVVGPPQWSITFPTIGIRGPGETDGPTTDPPGAGIILRTVIDVHAADVADLIAGSWPAPVKTEGGPVQVVMSAQTAARLGLTAGQTLMQFYKVVGIFQPKDPDADYWALNPGLLQASLYDNGNDPPTLTATVFTDPLNTESFRRQPGIVTQVWFPLELSKVSGANAALVLGQIRAAVAKKYNVPTAPLAEQPPGSIQSLALTAGLIPALAAALDRIASARSVLLVAAIGPLGAVVAVVVLGLSALAQRRRPTIAALATRGGSARQIRTLLAVDGLISGLVPAVLAIIAGWLVFRGDFSSTGAILAGLAGLIPAGYLACTPIAQTVQRGRPDSGVRARHRFRWVGEVAVLAVAAVSVYLLFSAGLQAMSSATSASAPSQGAAGSSGTGGGVDVLVAAAPLLLAAAACVLVFRLYPLPLRLLSAHYRRNRSAVGFLGSLRALRDPSVGVAPVLAVVVGVSVAVFSAATVSTLSTGIRAAAVSSVGADLRADSQAIVGITNDNIAAVRKLPGVAAAARIQWLRSTSTKIPDRANPVGVDVYLADLSALAAVQRDVVDAVPIPPGMTDASPPAVLVSTDLAGYITAAGGTIGPVGNATKTGTMSVDNTPVQVVGSADRLTGLGLSPTWVLGDASAGTPSKLGVFRPTTMLVSLSPGADPAAVGEEITHVLGPGTSISMPSEVVATANANPIVSALKVALIAALAVAALAAAAAVVLTMLLGTGTRTRLLAILRVLGMSVRQRRRLVVWEQAPTVAVALVIGAGLGLALTAVVRSVIDLRPFTTGAVQPTLSVGVGLLAALLGGFVVLVAAAIGVGLLLTRRIGIATVVRVDEE